MNKRINVCTQARNNWLIDAAGFVGGLLVALSGVYFLIVPAGGYQGGRNALYDVTILFDRSSWDDLHTWGGVTMIVAVVIHFAIHWRWLVMTSKRVVKSIQTKTTCMCKKAKFNLIIDMVLALSFLTTAMSGIYFLFMPGSGSQGGRNVDSDSVFLFNRTTWDLVHTWAGVIMIATVIVHIALHWSWIVNVTRRMFQWLRYRYAPGQVAERNLA